MFIYSYENCFFKHICTTYNCSKILGLIQGATQNPLASSLPTIGLHLPQTPHDIHLAAAQANLEASR